MNCQLSVIIPVHNEAAIIGHAVSHLQSQNCNGCFEIIVVDGNPDGSTLEALYGWPVQKLVSKKGRAVQMNCGASAARGDILLFLHADTRLPENGFNMILNVFERGQAAGGAFNLGIRSEKKRYRLIERVVRIRTRLTKIPYGDQGIFLKRNVFTGIGGYQEIPIMEDVDLMRRIKAAGHRIFVIPDKVQTSPRRWEREGVVRCTVRNWMLIVFYLLGAPPVKLAKYY